MITARFEKRAPHLCCIGMHTTIATNWLIWFGRLYRLRVYYCSLWHIYYPFKQFHFFLSIGSLTLYKLYRHRFNDHRIRLSERGIISFFFFGQHTTLSYVNKLIHRNSYSSTVSTDTLSDFKANIDIVLERRVHISWRAPIYE